MFITASHSVSVEYDIPQNKGESALRLEIDDLAKQGRSVTPELEPATVGVGRKEDPVPKIV